MKKVLVVIVVGLLGVVGYQMEQMDNLIQSNKALEKQNLNELIILNKLEATLLNFLCTLTVLS